MGYQPQNVMYWILMVSYRFLRSVIYGWVGGVENIQFLVLHNY